MKAPIRPKLKNEWDDKYVNKKISKRDFMVESYVRTDGLLSKSDCESNKGGIEDLNFSAHSK